MRLLSRIKQDRGYLGPIIIFVPYIYIYKYVYKKRSYQYSYFIYNIFQLIISRKNYFEFLRYAKYTYRFSPEINIYCYEDNIFRNNNVITFSLSRVNIQTFCENIIFAKFTNVNIFHNIISSIIREISTRKNFPITAKLCPGKLSNKSPGEHRSTGNNLL